MNLTSLKLFAFLCDVVSREPYFRQTIVSPFFRIHRYFANDQPDRPSSTIISISADSWDLPRISGELASGLAKSANKHNRLYLKAEALEGELVQAIEEGQAGPKADSKEAARLLSSKFGWDKQVPRLHDLADLSPCCFVWKIYENWHIVVQTCPF